MNLIDAERLIHTFQEEVCEANKVWCSECPFWRPRSGECLIENHIRIEAEKISAEGDNNDKEPS